MGKTWARCDKSLTTCCSWQSILVCFGGIWELDGLWSRWFTKFHDFWRWEGSRSSNGGFENFCIVNCPLRGSFYLFTFCSTYVRYTPLLAVCLMTWENFMMKRKWFLPIPRNSSLAQPFECHDKMYRFRIFDDRLESFEKMSESNMKFLSNFNKFSASEIMKNKMLFSFRVENIFNWYYFMFDNLKRFDFLLLSKNHFNLQNFHILYFCFFFHLLTIVRFIEKHQVCNHSLVFFL